MFAISDYTGFIMAVCLFQLYPGPGTMAILDATARKGTAGGMKAVFGTLTGDFIYMLAAVMGLTALLAACPGLLEMVQWMGAGYLIWIGVAMLCTASPHRRMHPENEIRDWHFFYRGLAVSLTNPKAILFFMAFFPLFLKPDAPAWTPGILMAHVTAISFIYQTALVFAGNRIIRGIVSFRFFRTWAHRLAGMAIAGFGIRLLLSRK